MTYLQFRHILELIATALLVVNKAAANASDNQKCDGLYDRELDWIFKVPLDETGSAAHWAARE